jgi:hypothetical protein
VASGRWQVSISSQSVGVYTRFLRISLGSAKETRGWYYRGRHVFDPTVVEHRMNLANKIISGLVTTAAQQRKYEKGE